MKVTSKEIQKEFMKSMISVAKALGINCTITTDAGTEKFDINNPSETKDEPKPSWLDDDPILNSKSIEEMMIKNEYRKDRKEITFGDLNRRVAGKGIYGTAKTYIGDDVSESHMKFKGNNFNRWSLTFHGTMFGNVLTLYAISNKYNYQVFHAVLTMNNLAHKCLILLAFDEAPCRVYDVDVDINTKILDIDSWAFNYRKNDLVLSLVSKLVELAEP